MTHVAYTRHLDPLQVARNEFISKWVLNKPHVIAGNADAADLQERAEHLQTFWEAAEKYTNAILQNTRQHSPERFDLDVTGCLSDVKGDVVGTLMDAAEKLREGD